MKRSGATDLVTPSSEEVVRDGEEEREEYCVGEVERERECIGGFWGWCRGS